MMAVGGRAVPSVAKGPGRPRVLTEEQIGAGVLAVGFTGFSVRALAARLEVGEKTLYRYASGRDEMIALGIEQLMRTEFAQFVDPGAGTGWREVLLGVAERTWTFLVAHPAAGIEIARGVHTRPEVEFTTGVARVLMRQGFSADQAVLALGLLFNVVLNQFRTSRYLDVSVPGGEPPQRGAIVDRLALAQVDGERDPVRAALRDAMGVTPKQWLDRQLSIVLDGIGALLER